MNTRNINSVALIVVMFLTTAAFANLRAEDDHQRARDEESGQQSIEKRKHDGPSHANETAGERGEGRKAESKPAAKQRVNQQPRKTPVKLSVDQEDIALKFAGTHHPELAALLRQLRKSSPAGFTRGIREVHNAAQRLKRFQEKQPARFATELRNWKTDSKIRLLTARWAVSNDDKLEEQIQGLLRARQEARIRQMKEQRRKLAAQVRALNEQIGANTEDIDAKLASEWERLSKRAINAARVKERSARNTAPNTAKPNHGQSNSPHQPTPRSREKPTADAVDSAGRT